MTLEEYFEKSLLHKHLVENLRVNIKSMCTPEMSDEEQASLLRLQLIMIRDFMETRRDRLKEQLTAAEYKLKTIEK